MKKEKTNKKKSGSIGSILMVLAFMVIGGVCGVIMGPYIENLFDSGKPLPWVLLDCALLLIGLYAALFLQIIIHEAGHMVFGLMIGYKFSSFRILSFMLLKEEDGLKFRRLNLAGTGGQCLMCPPDMVDGKFPFALYNLGGSFLNLIASLVFGVLYLLLSNVSYLSTLLLMLVVIGVGFALINGLPLRMGTVDNDGYNTLSISRDPEALRAFWVQMKANECISRGTRLKDMPPEWFEMPSEAGMHNSITATIAAFRCNYLLDGARLPEAEAQIDALLSMDSALPGLYKSLLTCDRIFCLLVDKGDKETAGKLMTKELEKFMKAMKQYPSVLRTQYTYALLAEKDPEKAGSYLRAFDKTAKTYPYPSDIEGERELLELASRTENA